MQHLPERLMAQRAEHARSVFFATIPTGTTLQDCLVPSFWAHCVGRLKVNTLIELVAEDGSFDALARVTDRDVGFAKLRLLRAFEDKKATPVAGEHDDGKSNELPRIQRIPNGSAKGWRLLGLDGNVVKEAIQDKRDAEAQLEIYKQRALA